jgi:hypothetical protein
VVLQAVAQGQLSGLGVPPHADVKPARLRGRNVQGEHEEKVGGLYSKTFGAVNARFGSLPRRPAHPEKDAKEKLMSPISRGVCNLAQPLVLPRLADPQAL